MDGTGSPSSAAGAAFPPLLAFFFRASSTSSFFFSFFSFFGAFPAGGGAAVTEAEGAGVANFSAASAGFLSFFFEGSALRSALGAFSRSNWTILKDGARVSAEERTDGRDCM